jgi:hypothetical protein
VNTTRRGGSTTTYSPRIGTPLMSSTSLRPGVGSSSVQSPIHRKMTAGSIRSRGSARPPSGALGEYVRGRQSGSDRLWCLAAIRPRREPLTRDLVTCIEDVHSGIRRHLRAATHVCHRTDRPTPIAAGIRRSALVSGRVSPPWP